MRLATLLDPTALSARCPPAFAGEAERWTAAARRLLELGHGETAAARAFFVPGRIEVVGKHTDYAGGRSLVAATRQGFHLAVAERADRRLCLHDLASGEKATLDLDGELVAAPGCWSAYPSTVARRLRRDFGLELRGAEMVFSSNLPAAGGMSSSSAFVAAAWLALAAVGGPSGCELPSGESAERLWLAEYLAAVEGGREYHATFPHPFFGFARHVSGRFGRARAKSRGEDEERGIGTRGGSEDHTAILCSRAGCLGQYSYAPTRHERTVGLAEELTFAIAASGVRAEKAASARAAYNRLSDHAAELADRWRRQTGGSEPHLAAILARGPGERGELARIAAKSPAAAELTRRLEHFLAESEEIVPAATEALAAGDLPTFGRVVDRSQKLGRTLLGNQVAETVHLAASARELGALAASAFGAGFGGAVWALVERRRLASFLDRWRDGYLGAHPERRDAASFFAGRPGPGAFELGAG